MANQTSTATRAGSTQHFELDGSTNLALDVPAEEAPGADQVPDAALSVAVDDSADDDCDPPELWDDYGDERRAYANSVGMRLWEKI